MSRSFHKTERSLPSSPQKKVEGIGTLSKKFNLRITVHNKSGKKQNKLSEEEEEWIQNFLERSDTTYKTTRGKNAFSVEIYCDKREYKQKRYLIWEFRNLLEIINGSKIITNEDCPSFTESSEHQLSFR